MAVYRSLAASPGVRDQIADMGDDELSGLPRERLVRIYNYGYEPGTLIYHEGRIIRAPEIGEFFEVGHLHADQLIGKSSGKLGYKVPINKPDTNTDETPEQRRARLQRELEELNVVLEAKQAAKQLTEQRSEQEQKQEQEQSEEIEEPPKRRGRPRKK